MNASQTAQKESPRHPSQNSLDPALAMHAGGAERRPSGLTDFGRGLDQVKASAVRLVPRLRAVASPLPAATRYGPSVDGVPFRTTGRHGIEDTANLRLPVHGSREKRHHCPTSKLRGGRERAQVTSRAIQLTCSHSSLSRFLVESKAIERNVRSGDS